MNPFAVLWATFLAWYHDPSRILGSFDRIQRRLSAASAHHNALAVAASERIARLDEARVEHLYQSGRAKNVSSKLAELLT